MKAAAWLLLFLSILLFVLGVVARFPATHTICGQPPLSYWRGAMGLGLYAIALRMLGSEGAEHV